MYWEADQCSGSPTDLCGTRSSTARSADMPIYEPLVADGYERVNAVREQDDEVFLGFDGQHRTAAWRPIAVRRVRADAISPYPFVVPTAAAASRSRRP